MDMNPHSLSRSHSRSTLHNVPLYASASTRYSRQRTQMSHSAHHHPYQDQAWNPSAMVVPPVLQKVYILDCVSCNTFLTNRGMRAVLLLQPEVALYSTDALPVNCSATPGPFEYAPPFETVTTSSSSFSCPAGVSPPVPRTCECLTQTLCCHGCGNSVGYMVVIPCNRCTSSVSPTNRHTNRHRFVFFNKEIVASERHYIPHEPGVITSSPVLVTAMSPSSSIHSPDQPNPHGPQYNIVDPQYFHPSSGSTPSLPTPPPDSPTAMDYHSQNPHTFPPSLVNYPPQSSLPPFQFVTLKSERVKLRAGDVIYWHNLSRSGEIPAVVEDDRARESHNPTFSPWVGR